MSLWISCGDVEITRSHTAVDAVVHECQNGHDVHQAEQKEDCCIGIYNPGIHADQVNVALAQVEVLAEDYLHEQ